MHARGAGPPPSYEPERGGGIACFVGVGGDAVRRIEAPRRGGRAAPGWRASTAPGRPDQVGHALLGTCYTCFSTLCAKLTVLRTFSIWRHE